MVEEPDRLRQDIESTRASLTRDVDRLAEKTSPKQMARRRWTTVKEKVMGSTGQASAAAGRGATTAVDTVQEKASSLGDKASQFGDAVGSRAQDAAGAVRSAPQAVTRQAQGNPVAAGIIAFGVGMLAATLIPVTDAERRAGQELKEHGDQLTERAEGVAGDLREDLGGTVQEAAGRVKDTAQDAAQSTGEQVRSSARDVKDQAVQAARDGG